MGLKYRKHHLFLFEMVNNHTVHILLLCFIFSHNTKRQLISQLAGTKKTSDIKCPKTKRSECKILNQRCQPLWQRTSVPLIQAY